MSNRNDDGYLQIGGRPYYGYWNYELIDGPLNSFEQQRVTSVIKPAKGGLRHALKHCQALEQALE